MSEDSYHNGLNGIFGSSSGNYDHFAWSAGYWERRAAIDAGIERIDDAIKANRGNSSSEPSSAGGGGIALLLLICAGCYFFGNTDKTFKAPGEVIPKQGTSHNRTFGSDSATQRVKLTKPAYTDPPHCWNHQFWNVGPSGQPELVGGSC